MTRKVGRPRRGNSVADVRLTVRLTRAERLAWDRAARADGMGLGEWVRTRCAGLAPVLRVYTTGAQ